MSTLQGETGPSRKQTTYQLPGTEVGIFGPKRVPRPLLRQGLDHEKDAMTSLHLDRKEVQCVTCRVHITGLAWPVETQNGFFCCLAGPLCTDRISIYASDMELMYKHFN